MARLSAEELTDHLQDADDEIARLLQANMRLHTDLATARAQLAAAEKLADVVEHELETYTHASKDVYTMAVSHKSRTRIQPMLDAFRAAQGDNNT